MKALQDYGQLATKLAEMAQDLVGLASMQDTLDSIVNHAVGLVAGCDAAGILAIRSDAVETLACAGPVERVAERIQGQGAEGLWSDVTVRGEKAYRIEDTYAPEASWWSFAQRARELGIGSMMGFLLHTTGEGVLGGLELYAGSRGAFRDDAEHAGWLLASHTAVALASARHDLSLSAGLASSRAIGEAVGLVRARYGLSGQAAFAAIRRASQEQNIKVRDLAETIIEMGELPGHSRISCLATMPSPPLSAVSSGTAPPIWR